MSLDSAPLTQPGNTYLSDADKLRKTQYERFNITAESLDLSALGETSLRHLLDTAYKQGVIDGGRQMLVVSGVRDASSDGPEINLMGEWSALI